MILETEPNVIASRVAMRGADADLPLSEQVYPFSLNLSSSHPILSAGIRQMSRAGAPLLFANSTSVFEADVVTCRYHPFADHFPSSGHSKGTPRQVSLEVKRGGAAAIHIFSTANCRKLYGPHAGNLSERKSLCSKLQFSISAWLYPLGVKPNVCLPARLVARRGRRTRKSVPGSSGTPTK